MVAQTLRTVSVTCLSSTLLIGKTPQPLKSESPDLIMNYLLRVIPRQPIYENKINKLQCTEYCNIEREEKREIRRQHILACKDKI